MKIGVGALRASCLDAGRAGAEQELEAAGERRRQQYWGIRRPFERCEKLVEVVADAFLEALVAGGVNDEEGQAVGRDDSS